MVLQCVCDAWLRGIGVLGHDVVVQKVRGPEHFIAQRAFPFVVSDAMRLLLQELVQLDLCKRIISGDRSELQQLSGGR